MSTPPTRLSDHAIEQFIGRVLQIGVLIAAAVTLTGGILLLAKQGGTVPAFAPFRGQPAYLTSVDGVLRAVRERRSDALVQLGILLLIAVPIVRVACTLVAFVLQRDRTYVLITLLVLGLLMYGLFFGAGAA
jgi:uncharacterized membrane protein